MQQLLLQIADEALHLVLDEETTKQKFIFCIAVDIVRGVDGLADGGGLVDAEGVVQDIIQHSIAVGQLAAVSIYKPASLIHGVEYHQYGGLLLKGTKRSVYK